MKCRAEENRFPAVLAFLLVELSFLNCLISSGAMAQTVVSANPDADAFLCSSQPASNFGGAGGLSISGSAAVNGSGDSWIEGSGTPSVPTPDGVTWSNLAGIVNSNLDVSLGTFTNAGVNGQMAFSLGLPNAFVEDIAAGGEVSLHLTAASPTVGFTFNSRSYINSDARPQLEITASAVPQPRIDQIALSGTDVLVSFESVSNWNYHLQGSETLGGAATNVWSDLLVVPAQTTSGTVVYRDGVTNRQRFYRLSVSQ